MRNKLKKAAESGMKVAGTSSQAALAAAHGMGQSSSSTVLPAYTPGAAVERYLLIVKVFKARNLKWGSQAKMLGFSKFRPYVSVSIQNTKIGQTGVGSSKMDEPKFNETFFAVTSTFLPRAAPGSVVTIGLHDYDPLSTSDLGTFVVTPQRAVSPQSWNPEWYPTTNKQRGEGEVSVNAVIVPLDEAFQWTEVPMGDFPMRHGNHVRLYQDAFSPVPFLPHMPPRNAFEDMYESLTNAKQFIYMTGWSVWTKLYLLRGKECEQLGKLLADKADQGLQVCVLVWDELTSVGDGVASGGLMSTFDEETRTFFKDTKVSCRTLHRFGHLGYEQAVFSHHQKTIICDNSSGKITAYVGGLDVTNGRWDTPDHRIFSSLTNDHKDDFYSACVAEASQETGPRQPWHDIHSRVEGQVAVDVYENFRQRWEMVPGEGMKAENATAPAAILKGVGGAGVATDGGWNCQLLRSIDRYSIDTKMGESEPNVVRSIHNTYVLRIATAQRFIYIENQYFMGSSHFWDDKIDPGLRNLVPILITEKIISKIVAKQDFTAYIIVPLFPEGVPETVGVQAMLRWQFLTVSMMYKRVFDALKVNGVQNKTVEDYLMFMCVANREEPPKLPEDPKGAKRHGTIVNGRHMIYVHSKMIIVDDEFILIGSANINDRSLRGDRDTEIAVVMNQRPAPGKQLPMHSQELNDFRLSLWSEHFGGMDERFRQPNSLNCVRHIQSLCANNWEKYCSDNTGSRLTGHACRYPYTMNPQTGALRASGNGKFPDYPLADIEGKLSALPNHVTT